MSKNIEGSSPKKPKRKWVRYTVFFFLAVCTLAIIEAEDPEVRAKREAAEAEAKAVEDAAKPSRAVNVLNSAFERVSRTSYTTHNVYSPFWIKDEELDEKKKNAINEYLANASSWYKHTSFSSGTEKYGPDTEKYPSALNLRYGSGFEGLPAKSIDARLYLQKFSKEIPPLDFEKPILKKKDGTCEIEVLRAYYTDSHPTEKGGDWKKHRQRAAMLYNVKNNDDLSQKCWGRVGLYDGNSSDPIEAESDPVQKRNTKNGNARNFGPQEKKHCLILNVMVEKEVVSFTPKWHITAMGKKGGSFLGSMASALGGGEKLRLKKKALKLGLFAFNEIIWTEQRACEFFFDVTDWGYPKEVQENDPKNKEAQK